MSEKALVVENLTCKFDGAHVLKNISFNVKKGEFLVIVGPSPSGKSTLLNCIAGLVETTSGSIYMDGEDMVGVPPHKRNISLVFQDLALFPHMNVYDNIAFGLRMKALSKNEVKKAVDEVMRLVRLEGLNNRNIRQLSGGQQQRVALARSLVIKPRIILFDEPIASLDLKLRDRMLVELKSLHRELGFTGIYVTNEQHQAMILADRIMIMNRGLIEQLGIPHEVYTNPRNIFVATTFGEINRLDGKVESTNKAVVTVKTSVGKLKAKPSKGVKEGEKVIYAIRPEKVLIGEHVKERANKISVKLREQLYIGSTMKYVTQLPDGEGFNITAKGKRITDLSSSIGHKVPVGWSPKDGLVLEEERN